MAAVLSRRRCRNPFPTDWEGPTVLLDVPVRLQADSWSCGPACAAAVLQFFGRPVPRHLPASPIDGTDPLALVPVFRRAGLRVQAGEMDAADLRHHTRSGRPVVCLVREGLVGHYVVVRGVSKATVHYHDPASGHESEPLSAFLRRWWDESRDVRYEGFGIATWDKD